MKTENFLNDFTGNQPVSGKPLSLDDGSRVAVVGGGPAGSFFAFYLLDMADRADLDISVDVYEPRDFDKPAPLGCNMCGGIISESLVQNLAADGMNLPPSVVRRGIDAYMLHTDKGSVLIKTPLQEKRIAAVFRGSGPRDVKEIKWGSFDGHLQKLTREKGAQIVTERIMDISFDEAGRPVLKTRNQDVKSYDLLVVATGVNSPILRQLEALDIGYEAPGTTKTFICEYFLGSEVIEDVLGSAMHVFLLNIPRLKFAAIIPKGDYVTVCMLGEDIDDEMIDNFLGSKVVQNCMPEDWQMKRRSCRCASLMNIHGAVQPFADRVVVIGDSGVTRLYKDGIGAAYRTAKAAAATVVFQGISKEAFQNRYWPICQNILADNAIGKFSFFITGVIQKIGFARKGLVRMTRREQENRQMQPRMSLVMWDMFTGSAPYREILIRTLHPAFIARFIADILLSIPKSKESQSK